MPVTTTWPPLPVRLNAGAMMSPKISPTVITVVLAILPQVISPRTGAASSIEAKVCVAPSFSAICSLNGTVDGDHVARAGRGRTLDRVDPDAADADDDHRVAGVGVADLDGRSPSGGHTAAEQRRLAQRDVVLDLDQRGLVDGDVGREGAQQTHRRQWRPVGGVQAVGVIGDRQSRQQPCALVADVLQSPRTRFAGAAGGMNAVTT